MLTDSPATQWASSEAFELFHIIIDKRLALGRAAVADSTALSKQARRDLRRIARARRKPVVLIVLNVSKSTCLERDAGRRRRVGEEVIGAHIAKLNDALKDLRNEKYDAVHILNETEMDRVRIKMRKN